MSDNLQTLVLPKNKLEILEIFRRYDFRDPLGHSLEYCAEFQMLVAGYCGKEPTLKELYEKRAEINDNAILSWEQLAENMERIAKEQAENYKKIC